MVLSHSIMFAALKFWYYCETVSLIFTIFVQEIHNIC